MTSRDRTILAVVCVLAAIVAPWLLVISPKRSEASKLASELSAAQSQLDSTRARASANVAAKASFSKSYTAIARLGEAVPSDDDVPSLIYQLQGAAGHAHVEFLGLQTASASSSASTSSPSAQQASAGSLPPNVTAGANGFNDESFTLTFQGSYVDLTSFVNHLQRFVVAEGNQLSVSGRLLTLNAINLSAGAKGFPQIVATISATSYLTAASPRLPIGPTASSSSSAASQGVSTGASGSSPSPTAAITAPAP